ncbi:MAG: septal ring lytic transglycosylase RlpA family protein [Cyanobacterium sp. T60_A2020_053]|nr:septal ring lytic transglycosylase RlpA family protein [Cyanobacterium sp. T60_A2020_053]
MLKNICNNAVKTAMTMIIGLTGLTITTDVKAETAPFTDSSQSITSSTQTNIVSKLPSVQEFIFSKIYPHQWQDKMAATLHFKNIPLLTFLGNDQNQVNQKAQALALRLERLSQGNVNAEKVAVKWDDKKEQYTINYDQQEIIALTDEIILPDSTDDQALDALQATNRLRRLLGNAQPLDTIINQPQQKILAKPVTVASTAGVKSSGGRIIRGRASWYGPGFHGRRTANGEKFNQNALTAAHRSLPFGTRVKVTNVRNGRSVVVRINDRGPFSGGRIIDLAAGAANAIGLKGAGVATVTVQILGR